ncbi:hypothetical protein COAQ111491_16960 [Comamonas aquatilis]|uniref:PglL family O-oligosaccharyltransferase n=1 Tax=Comamonas aquatilis TaxID=1778406 RepID=UPI0039EF5EF5
MIENIKKIAFIFILPLPWLWPISFGPWAEAIPWLFSLAVAAIIMVVWPVSEDNVTTDIATAFAIGAVISVFPEIIQYFGLSSLEIFWPWIRDTAPGVSIGNIGQPNQQATLLAIGLISTYWIYCHRRISLPAFLAASTLISIGIALSASRTGALYLLCVPFISWWIFKSDKKIFFCYIFACFFFYVLTSLAAPYIANSIGIENAKSVFIRIIGIGSSCESRSILWGNVIELISQKPWQGWGWNNLRYAQYITDFESPRLCSVLGNAHNIPLHFAVTLGIPITIFICSIAIYFFIKLTPWKETNPKKRYLWAVLIPIGIHSMLEFPLWYGPFQIISAICIYLIIKQKTNPIGFKKNTAIRYCVSVSVMALSLWVFIDYQRVTQVYLPPDLRVEELKTDSSLEKSIIYSSKTIFFSDQSNFATVIFINPDKNNSLIINKLANNLLHFSPEPRVIKRLLESALIIGDTDQYNLHKKRFEITYPKEYLKWLESESANN